MVDLAAKIFKLIFFNYFFQWQLCKKVFTVVTSFQNKSHLFSSKPQISFLPHKNQIPFRKIQFSISDFDNLIFSHLFPCARFTVKMCQTMNFGAEQGCEWLNFQTHTHTCDVHFIREMNKFTTSLKSIGRNCLDFPALPSHTPRGPAPHFLLISPRWCWRKELPSSIASFLASPGDGK